MDYRQAGTGVWINVGFNFLLFSGSFIPDPMSSPGVRQHSFRFWLTVVMELTFRGPITKLGATGVRVGVGDGMPRGRVSPTWFHLDGGGCCCGLSRIFRLRGLRRRWGRGRCLEQCQRRLVELSRRWMAHERQRFVAESVQQIGAAKISTGRIQLGCWFV